MNKSNSKLENILNNFRNLVPYIGVLLVAAGIIGLIFVQNPLTKTQDVRSEAVNGRGDELPELLFEYITPSETASGVYYKINQEVETGLHLNPKEYSVASFHTTFNIVSPDSDVDNVEVYVNVKSGYKADDVQTQKTADGYLVKVEASLSQLGVLTDPNAPLIHVTTISKKPGLVSFSFDPDLTFAETNQVKVAVTTPENVGYNIYDPDAIEPPPTSPPPITVSGCNESCSSNADCDINLRCYSESGNKYCRLVTNPSSNTCAQSSGGDDGETQTTLRTCNQFCESSSECDSSLTCYQSFCRNPENPQDNRCAVPSEEQATLTIQQCGQTCNSNADCAVNLRCFQSECRLVTNPSSTSCSPASEETVSNTYKNKAENITSVSELADTDTPLKKGDNLIPDEELNVIGPSGVEADRIAPDTSFAGDETLLGLIKNLVANSQSRLPMFIVLLGVLLLLISIFVSVISRLGRRKSSTGYHPKSVDASQIDVKTFDVESNLENKPKA